MDNPAWVAAVAQLQTQMVKTADLYVEERASRAADEVLRLRGDARPRRQVRSASAHAGELLKRRREALTFTSLDVPEQVNMADSTGRDDSAFALVDMQMWLSGSQLLKEPEKDLLLDLAVGHDAESLALRDGQPVTKMRQRISRARRAAIAAYAVEVAA